ncbi:hypothetical protein [Fibrivirga algicola]|uniref:ABC transporter permease n=1 Tax=Fibrivirga algicola TaxID=2950420 RepID=A0ABX0QNY5_9BACT|nr:hypothetical protein [Fibrivirga algicola]NID12981.1 hypothetical protein [Fibrivirga algicola]
MNQTFSFSRFTRLHRWLWATKSRTYLFGALALIPIILLIPSQVLSVDHFNIRNTQSIIMAYFFSTAIILTFSMGSDIFSALFKQESAISYIMIPASRPEKFWLGILYWVAALLLLGVVYFSYEALIFSIANKHLPAAETERYVSTLIFYTRPVNNERSILPLTLFALLASLSTSLLCSFYFRRGVFARTIGITLFTTFCLFLLYGWLIKLILGGHFVGTAIPFYPIAVHVDKQNYELLGPPNWLKYGAYAGTLLMLWVIARIRFNEIER